MAHQVVVVAGWYPDPSTRHEFRYWDGVAWTEHVADAGRASVEAVGSAPAVGAGVSSAGSSPDPTFPPEVRRRLEARGYVIYRLTGKSIADLQAAGQTIHILSSQGAEEVDREEPSLHSEVAVYAQARPPIACGEDYPDQQAAVDAVNERWVRTTCPGAVAIIGNAADYACLIFEHLEATDHTLLFTEPYVISTSSRVGDRVASLKWSSTDGELLALETTAFGNRWHGVTPLIVPEQALRGGQVRRL